MQCAFTYRKLFGNVMNATVYIAVALSVLHAGRGTVFFGKSKTECAIVDRLGEICD